MLIDMTVYADKLAVIDANVVLAATRNQKAQGTPLCNYPEPEAKIMHLSVIVVMVESTVGNESTL
jgi:hypothetical protein